MYTYIKYWTWLCNVSNMEDGEDNKEVNILNKNEVSEKKTPLNGTGVLKEEETSDTNALNPTGDDNKEVLPRDKVVPFKVPESLTINNDKDAKTIKTTESEAERKDKTPELPYKIPWWSSMPPESEDYNLEMLKNGCIKSTIDLNKKAYHVIGRLPACDIVLEHPSISRYHAVIQYRGETDGDKSLSGFYLYDLGSTHGTLVNKAEIRAKTYYRLKVGFVIKFGGSSRLLVLQGPENDDEEMTENLATTTSSTGTTSENTTSVKAGQIFTDEEYDSLKKVEQKTEEPSEGIDWGFGEDAEPEDQIDSEKFTELYSGVEFKDPKKTLRGYYEREGLELEYVVDETGPGHARVYHCKVRLPVDGPNGSAVYAEASVSGRKREAVKECANEACKMLDAYGLLRQSNHESRKKRERNWEQDDFYESDEDNFLDRTGTVETKRQKRMHKAGKETSKVQTYESLMEKMTKVQEEIKTLTKRISDDEGLKDTGEGDSLDNFMNTISSSMDKHTKIKLKRKIIELRKEKTSLEKLISLAKPTNLPSLQSVPKNENVNDKSQDPAKKVDDRTEKENEVNKPNTQDESTSEQSKVKTDSTENLKTPSTSKPFSGFAMPSAVVKPRSSKKDPKIVASQDGSSKTASKENGKEETATNVGKEETATNVGKKEEIKGTEKRKTEEKSDETKKDETRENEVVKKKRYTAPTQWEDANDPDFANWVPPEGQTGDGRTKLNEKYGY